MAEEIRKIAIVIISCGIVQNCILAVSIIAQLRKKRDLKKALSFLFCLVSMVFFLLPPLIEFFRLPVDTALCAPFIAAMGPLYLISIRSVITGETRLRPGECVHFIPAAAAAFVVAFMPVHGSAGPFGEAGALPLPFAAFHASAYMAAAAIFLSRRIPGKIAGDDIDAKIKIRLVLVILHALCLAAAAAGSLIHPAPYHAALASTVIIVLANHIVSLRYPLKIDYYRNTKNRAFFAGILAKADPEALKEALDGKLAGEGLFREEMTLAGLASSLGIKTYQLSHFINNYLETNFTDLVNGYRVEDAKRRILADPGSTVLSVAYESGFNSKASFNRAFKKFTGMTPSDFRARRG